MPAPKFSLNAFLLVVLLAAAMVFFITVTVTDLADRTAVNTFSPIEGTELAVRYSSLEPNGIYRGSENVNTLLLKGNFGTDWGAAAEGDAVYLNEYDETDLGVMLCSVVRVQVPDMQKTVLLRNAVLRGRCASGELVCTCGLMLPSNNPEDSALCMLWRLTDSSVRSGGEPERVLFLDPQTGQAVYETACDAAEQDFDARFLSRTLEEVRG